VGIFFYRQLSSCAIIGLQLEWRPDFRSRVKVGPTEVKLHTENAFRAQLPITFYPNINSTTIDLIPFYDWNRFGRATESNSLGVPFPIPRLTRWDVGVRLLFNFCF
jgi:hypothetical protein